MSRVLKFRAWDKRKQEMTANRFVLAPTSPSWGAFNLHMTEELNDKINAFYVEAAGGDQLAGTGFNDLMDWADYYGLHEYEVMQFTGLLDSNGVEIYEGDIVYLAGYGNYEAVFPFIDLYEAAAELDIGEILGNRFQHPELLD